MKKCITLALAVVFAMGLNAKADPPYSMAVGTTSIVALASRTVAPSQAATYSTNAVYAQGAYVTISNLMYMVSANGVSGTSNLTHTAGEAGNGTATFRHMPTSGNNLILKRIGAAIQLLSGDDVFVTVGASAAVANKGEALLNTGDQWIPGSTPITQKEVRIISAGTSTVLISEQTRD